jgi:hypothetical protein
MLDDKPYLAQLLTIIESISVEQRSHMLRGLYEDLIKVRGETASRSSERQATVAGNCALNHGGKCLYQ